MKKIIRVKGVAFGEGKPKVCIPIVGNTKEEMRKGAFALQNVIFDVLELRIDYLECVNEMEYVIETVQEIREIIDKPILFTFRTKEEGGMASYTKEQYYALYEQIIALGIVEMIDLEVFLGEEIVLPLVKKAKEAGMIVVMSNHDFDKTPSKEQMIERLLYMHELGADIAKIAVMPNNKRDVLTLLDATLQITEEHPDVLVITMSMARLGAVSRIACELTGSVMTFATTGRSSAPGQVEVEVLNTVLEALNRE